MNLLNWKLGQILTEEELKCYTYSKPFFRKRRIYLKFWLGFRIFYIYLQLYNTFHY